MTDERNRDEPFVERISGKLRAVEHADASFGERVMVAVREAAATASAERARTWLLRPRSVRYTPIGAFALAAGLVIAVIALDRVVSPDPDAPPALATADATSTVDTVHVIRFVLADSVAQSVMLVGSFNGWNKAATPMLAHGADGVWTATLVLPAGRHEYAFLVHDAAGERWVTDPSALQLRDEFGATSSIVFIGGAT